VFDELDVDVPALEVGITRRTFKRQRVAGWAYPIEGELMALKGADRLKLDVVDALPEGSVSVWGGTNASGICLFGDLIAATMQKRGCHGAVVDGGFRDVEDISATGFPVFARYVSAVQSVGRWRVTSHGEPISLAGALGRPVPVSKDDFVLGDEDGVVVIPADLVQRVLIRAEEIVRMEQEARKLSAEGMTAAEMLEKFGHV
jgi:regulator of RNase E activity RraA